MKKVKAALWKDYDEACKSINEAKNSERYDELLFEERDKLRNEFIKIEQIKQDAIRNGITIGTFIVSTIVTCMLAKKTFEFDKTATVTSTLGRGILNNCISKFFKK